MERLTQWFRDRVRGLRRNQTDAERTLWCRLRNRQLHGAKFRRQFQIGRYIVDFCCPDKKLVVELDGGQHAGLTRADAERTAFLECEGYRVLRFWNYEVLVDPDGVLNQISHVLTPALSSGRRGDGLTSALFTSPSPSRGEGRDEGGFTIVELMIVITIVGILITIAEPSFSNTVVKAKEASLQQNLFTLRDVIDQYRADTGHYPHSVGDLKSAGYLKRIPMDPFTKSEATWQEILDDAEGGVFDVHSGSDLVGTNGIPYNQW